MTLWSSIIVFCPFFEGVFAAFGDDEEGLVAEVLGEVDVAELDAAYPAGDVLLAEGVEDIFEHCGLGFGVVFARDAAEGVEFFVVEVDDLVGLREEAVAFADGV